MRLLLLSDTRRTRAMVRRLLCRSGHSLVCRGGAASEELESDDFDLVLVDGQPGKPADTRRVRRMVDDLRHQGLPVVVLSLVNEAQGRGQPSVCIGGPGSGHRCPLGEMAYGQTEALLMASLSRPAGEPITFVYQG